MKLLIFMCLLFGAFQMNAQNMAAVFIAMPDEYIPQLEDAWRKDLVDLYNSGENAQLTNNMNGISKLAMLTKDYLLLESTERTTVEMKLLPLINNTFVICKIVTLKAPVADSRISFFSPDWQLLNAEDLFEPVGTEWFIREDADKQSMTFQEATAQLDVELFQYKLNPDDATLTQLYTTPDYTDKETQKKLKAFLKTEPKVYTWTKSYFK